MTDNDDVQIRVESGPFRGAIVPYLPHDYLALATFANKSKALNVLMAVLSMKQRNEDEHTMPIVFAEVGNIRFSEGLFSMFFFGVANDLPLAKKDELRKLLGDVSIYSICYNKRKHSMQLHSDEQPLVGCLQVDVSMAGVFSPSEDVPAIIVTEAATVPSRKRLEREPEETPPEIETACKRPSLRDCAETVLDQCTLFGRFLNRITNISTVDDIVEDAD